MNTTIIKNNGNLRERREELKKACAYFDAHQRLSMFQARLEILPDTEEDAKAELEKKIAELGGHADLSADCGEAFRAVTENPYDSMVFAIMGNKGRIFSDAGHAINKINGKGEVTGQKVQKIGAVETLSTTLYEKMVSAGNILSRLAGASMEEGENHTFTWARQSHAEDWRLYKSIIKDIVSMFKSGDSDRFYGVDIGKINNIAYLAYVQSAPRQKKNGEFPTVKTDTFVEQLTIILNQALEDADRIDNTPKTEEQPEEA